jgi:hypothetical protein
LYQSGSNFPKWLYSLYNSEQDWGTKKGASTPILIKFHRIRHLQELYLKKPSSIVWFEQLIVWQTVGNKTTNSTNFKVQEVLRMLKNSVLRLGQDLCWWQ